jgi:hypothetical protein
VRGEQHQKAGDGSAQFQAKGNIEIHQHGLDPVAAMEIFDARAEVLKRELTAHAESVVDERLGELSTRLEVRVREVPEILPAFADPDFQFNLLEAQRSASRSGEEDGYDLLVDLLTQRALTPSTPRLKLATRRAIDIVAELGNDSLAGLTTLFYGLKVIPIADTLDSMLQAIDDHVAPFVPVLPGDHSWLADLDVLDCISVSAPGLGGLKPMRQLLADRLTGFTCTGMTEEEAVTVRDRFAGFINNPETVAVGHPLAPERFCLLGPNEAQFRQKIGDAMGQRMTDPAVVDAVDQAVLLNQYEQQWPEARDALAERVADFPSLSALYEWWTGFPSMTLTAVGTAVAHANLRRALPDVTGPSLEAFL